MRVATQRFTKVQTEDLGRLPARVVAELLGHDGLAVGSEDEVYRAVAGYVEARDAMGGGSGEEGGEDGGRLSCEERRGLWGCCRFAYCSEGVQAKLARLPEANCGLCLATDYLLGVVSKRMAKEDEGAGAAIDGAGWKLKLSSQMRLRRTQVP